MEGADPLTLNKMGHQWFGDLVTCNDWSNLWLNEGFATFLAQLWEEHEYGADNAAYARWRGQAAWRRQTRLYAVPIVNRDFKDSMDFAGNIYGKAGLVLEMLRWLVMGDYPFFHGLQHYLEANRLKTVVTADLVKALDDSSGTNVDSFFNQWIYGAGAPQFTVDSSYDPRCEEAESNRGTDAKDGRPAWDCLKFRLRSPSPLQVARRTFRLPCPSRRRRSASRPIPSRC